MAQGITGRAFGGLDTTGGSQLGTPLFVLYHNSTLSAGTTSTETIVDVAPFSFRVIRADFVLTEAGNNDSEDVKLTDGTNDITEAKDYAASADKTLVTIATYDDDEYVINKGGALKLIKTATTAVTSFQMYVYCVRI